jgi:Fur family transcriptional regulator, ferric uptake regulator
MTALDQFKDFIGKTKLRMTRERELVIQAIGAHEGHFTVSVIMEKLKSEGAAIAPSTVYRIIPHLIEARLIRKAPHGNAADEQAYEQIFSHEHHDHLICEHCGEVIEFEDSAIEILQNKVAEQYGYKLKKHQLELRGVCPACQEKILAEAVNAW